MSAINEQKIVYINEKNLVNFNDIKSQILPFDILVFRGDGWNSNLICDLEERKTGNGSFSHIGMIITSDLLPAASYNEKIIPLTPGKLYIFESTENLGTTGENDILTNDTKLGVQLRDIEEVIPRYITDQVTKVAWCKLKNNPFLQREFETTEELPKIRNKLREKFAKLFKSYEGRLYQIDPLELLSGLFPILRPVRNLQEQILDKIVDGLSLLGLPKGDYGPLRWRFCSQLVMNIYQDFDIMPKSIDARNVLPVDFFGYDNNGVPVKIEAPIYIKDWDIPGEKAVIYDN